MRLFDVKQPGSVQRKNDERRCLCGQQFDEGNVCPNLHVWGATYWTLSDEPTPTPPPMPAPPQQQKDEDLVLCCFDSGSCPVCHQKVGECNEMCPNGHVEGLKYKRLHVALAHPH
jgi:hypothetical protein